MLLNQSLLKSLSQHRAQLHGKRIWLACSGGRDSLSLALLCRQLFDAGELPFLPQLIHVNHGMQVANETWAKQVKDWAKAHDMPCRVLKINLTQYSEQAARLGRYEAMQAVMNIDDVLMLGHHRDDQVETVLMRLFNGAGVNGLSGMKAWTTQNYNAVADVDADVYSDSSNDLSNDLTINQTKTIHLWRPWLEVSREQITHWAKQTNLNYIDDPTNTITANTITTNTINGEVQGSTANTASNDRAWLRSVLMPMIEARYPQASNAIARTSQLMQDASHIINEQAQADLDELIVVNPHSLLSLPSSNTVQSILDISVLQALSLPRQSAVIHTWLSPSTQALPPPKRLVDDVLGLAIRQDNNHRTCLYWNNTESQYQIYRYKQGLYRLDNDWAQWLDIPPLSQNITVDMTVNRNSAIQQNRSSISLKNNHENFDWQFKSLGALTTQLIKQIDALNSPLAASTDKVTFCFEPLPREIKLTLAGRIGRKSGKKLLQALEQPAFMRHTVVLVSVWGFESSDNLTGHVSDNSFKGEKQPLFILTLDKIVAVDSPFIDTIACLIESAQLTTIVL